MLRRCMNANSISYKRYGGRGIRVCTRWRHFENFFADMGLRPQGKNGRRAAFSIDRINNDGNYEPDNCRWATATEQRRNQSI